MIKSINTGLPFLFSSVVKAQIEAELERNWERLHLGLCYYKTPRYVVVQQVLLRHVVVQLVLLSYTCPVTLAWLFMQNM